MQIKRSDILTLEPSPAVLYAADERYGPDWVIDIPDTPQALADLLRDDKLLQQYLSLVAYWLDYGGLVLAGADLSGADLRGADLIGANLRRADLRGADLIGANLRDADLSRADLRGAKLLGAGFTGANLDYAIVHEEDLYGVALTDRQRASLHMVG